MNSQPMKTLVNRLQVNTKTVKSLRNYMLIIIMISICTAFHEKTNIKKLKAKIDLLCEDTTQDLNSCSS